MTLKEAKKLLKEEGWQSFVGLSYEPVGIKSPYYEKPRVVMALRVCFENKVMPLIDQEDLDARYARLRKCYERMQKYFIPIPSNDSSSDSNPALNESAKQFNDSLLDEQSKKINDLEDRLLKSESDYFGKVHLACERGREISRLNKIIHEKNELIKNLILERGKIARELTAEKAVHQVDLQATKSAESALLYHEKEYEKSLKEKDDVIDEISEELSCSKKREDELIETVKDYQKQLDDLSSKSSSSPSKASKKSSRRKNHKKSSNESMRIVVDDVVIPNDMYELLDFIFG